MAIMAIMEIMHHHRELFRYISLSSSIDSGGNGVELELEVRGQQADTEAGGGWGGGEKKVQVNWLLNSPLSRFAVFLTKTQRKRVCDKFETGHTQTF